jgi:hypothetical protein
VILHEFFHIYLKREIGQWYGSCKTVIDPMASTLVDALVDDESFRDEVIKAYWDVFEAYHAQDSQPF